MKHYQILFYLHSYEAIFLTLEIHVLRSKNLEIGKANTMLFSCCIPFGSL